MVSSPDPRVPRQEVPHTPQPTLARSLWGSLGLAVVVLTLGVLASATPATAQAQNCNALSPSGGDDWPNVFSAVPVVKEVFEKYPGEGALRPRALRRRLQQGSAAHRPRGCARSSGMAKMSDERPGGG